MNSYCVYKHTFPNDKLYIGITSQDPTRRWGKGLKLIKSENETKRRYG